MKNLPKTYNTSKSDSLPKPELSKRTKAVSEKCIFAVDASFVIKTWNATMERLTHRLSENVIGNKIDNVFPFLHDEIALVLSIGKKRRLKNYRNNCFMGTDLCGDIVINPVKDKKGKIKEVSVALNKLDGECPLDKKLSDSEKMIAIGKIASSLAHGVRNPLNAIKGAVVYLRERYGHESTLLEFSTIINEEIDKLDNFISNFLSASKGELKFVSVNINGMIKSILGMVKPRADIQNIKISHRLAVLPLIMADSFQIEQAVFNIVNNALEAMPDGGVIKIRTSMQWENNGDYVLIDITDTGKGIPNEELSKLGDLSESANNDKGFGIFLSREVIRAHNGKLLWESLRDRGTTFKIFLPVKHSG